MLRQPLRFVTIFLTIVLVVFCSSNSFAQSKLVLDGQLPDDSRLKALKTLNGYHPFVPPKTAEEWETRSDKLKRRVLVATGLWPMLPRTPLNAKIYGKSQRNGFTVEKVQFESLPGHIVTGLLFRPEKIDGKIPAVICPHGHWQTGRKYDHGPELIRSLISTGDERFEASGRTPIVARCVQLARMGCAVFVIDMIGYADSQQIPAMVSHRYSKRRPEFETKKNWGFFSTQAELRLQNIMGLQTWNCVRGLDFLSLLPEVDRSRLAVTGCSGGGTQSILLGAIDPRPIVSFPQGMVSTAMQGGCTCENCSLLRVEHGNVELAGLFAPRPQAMTAANDWTKEMSTKGFPELKELYSVLGAKKNVQLTNLVHFKHNYNYVTRELMYQWFNKHLKLGLPSPVIEEDFVPLTADEQNVWDKDHPQPEPSDKYERETVAWMTKYSDMVLKQVVPKNEKSLNDFRKVIGGAFDVLIGRDLDSAGYVSVKKIWKEDKGDYLEIGDVIRNETHGEELPVISFYPNKAQWNQQVVIWVDGRGKAGMYNREGKPNAEVKKLLNAGTAVIGADLYQQGEFVKTRMRVMNRLVDTPRQFAGFTYGYNHTLFAQRVHDLLTLVKFISGDKHEPTKIDMIGLNGAGPLVAAVRAQVGRKIRKAIIDTQGFRFKNLTNYQDENFLCGAVKYGDVPAMLALSAPLPVWILGESDLDTEMIEASYNASNAVNAYDALNIAKNRSKGKWNAEVDWLLK